MAPQLPDRYALNVRLGRDGDVEEWLATDTALDRPVLVRIVGPDAAPPRHHAFLDGVRRAAGATHPHLAAVYAAATTPGGSFAVIEWTGGISVADRIAARETIPVDEYLPNAAGLASGLAVLHEAGAVHGAIDASAIEFSAAHPAKLGRYGRAGRHDDPARDTADLAAVLLTAITGSDEDDLAPSQVAAGLPPAVDDALLAARNGRLDAAGLAAALRSAPSVRQTRGVPWSWRWLIPAGVLFAVAVLISLAGLALNPDPNSPFLFPAPQTGDAIPTTTTTLAPDQRAATLTVLASVHDPFGDGTENDELVAGLVDGDPASSWSTERYSAPLRDIKPGVGVTFVASEAPRSIEVTGTAGTGYTLAWADRLPDSFDAWEEIAAGSLFAGRTTVPVPSRTGGTWLLWLTDLPADASGETHGAAVNEVRFLR